MPLSAKQAIIQEYNLQKTHLDTLFPEQENSQGLALLHTRLKITMKATVDLQPTTWSIQNLAAFTGNKVFLNQLFDENDKASIDLSSLLLFAVYGNNLALVDHLMTKENAATASTIHDKKGRSLAQIAYDLSYLKLARYLIDEAKVNPAQQDRDGRTLLHSAAICSDIDFASFLNNRGVDPEAKDQDGFTPLFYAAQNGSMPLISYLIVEAGANPAKLGESLEEPFNSLTGILFSLSRTKEERTNRRTIQDYILHEELFDLAQRCSPLISEPANNSALCSLLYYSLPSLPQLQLRTVAKVKIGFALVFKYLNTLDPTTEINREMARDFIQCISALKEGCNDRFEHLHLAPGSDNFQPGIFTNVATDSSHYRTCMTFLSEAFNLTKDERLLFLTWACTHTGVSRASELINKVRAKLDLTKEPIELENFPIVNLVKL